MAVGPLFQPVAKCALSGQFPTCRFDFELQTVGNDFADIGVNLSTSRRRVLLQSGDVFRWLLQMNIQRHWVTPCRNCITILGAGHALSCGIVGEIYGR